MRFNSDLLSFSKQNFRWITIITFLFLILMTICPNPVFSTTMKQKAVPVTFSIPVPSAILMESETGTILYQKNIHKKIPPASIVKVMTLLLAMEALDAGQMKLDSQVTVSRRASTMGGSQVYLKEKEVMRVEDILKAIAIASANDASVAIAEYLAGSVEGFVDQMNRRAEQLGMNDTYFRSPHGLPANRGEDDDISSAYDIAIMSRELILRHPQVLAWTATRLDSLRHGKFMLTNTNQLIQKYSGMDGLKTGYIDASGWGLAATAKRHTLRFISVVLGANSQQNRFVYTARLLDYGFRQYTKYLVAEKGKTRAEVRIQSGTREGIKVEAVDDLLVLVRRGKERQIKKEMLFPEIVTAPINKGQKIGEFVAYLGEEAIGRVDLVSPVDVDKIGLVEQAARWIKSFF